MCGEVVPASDLETVVSNVGVMADLSALFTPNSGMHTAFVQVGLKSGHHVSSFEYMERVRQRMNTELPQLRTYFQSGGLVDAVLNQGVPAPIDIQVSGSNLHADDRIAQDIAQKLKSEPGISDVYIPQDMDYPALKIDVNRVRASELGLNPKEVVDNVITALTSDAMIAPSYWVDPKNGNNYFVTVQYPENQVKSLDDLKAMPLRAPGSKMPTYLNQVADIGQIKTPTEVDHYQLQRMIDIYVTPKGEDLGAAAKKCIENYLGGDAAVERAHQHARAGGNHAIVVSQFRFWIAVGHFAGLPDLGRAIFFVPGPVSDRAGGSYRTGGSHADAGVYRHHAEHPVADGDRHAAGNGGLQQHSDRGFRQPVAERRKAVCGRRLPILAASACDRF